ncbi:hypothetical protein EI94DRAFT_1459595, partial [Lactarius quietus]
DAWVDFHEVLTVREVKELDASIQPVRTMLVKLRKMAFTLNNSTTLLLPQWYNTVATHRLPCHMKLCDVSTSWNSTFDMLDFTLQYRPVIDMMTATQDFDFCKHELVPIEWRIAGELRDILQV